MEPAQTTRPGEPGHIDVRRFLQGAHLGANLDEREATEIAARFGLFRIDARSWAISWSAGIAHIFGREMPRGGWLDLDTHLTFYHPDDCCAVRNRIKDALAGRSPTEYQNRGRIIRPDGDIRGLVAQGFVERDGSGSVTFLHGIIIDMTEMLRLEQRACESNDLLRTTLESVNQGILMVGPDRRVRVHNRRVRELLDLPEHLLLNGTSFDDILEYQSARGEFDGGDPDDRYRLQLTTADLYERRRPNGTVLEVRTERLADGGYIRTYEDVTERHESKAALKESEQRHRLLAEHTSDIIIWCDLDSTRRYVSPAASSMLGFEPDELVGTKPATFVHPDDAAQFARILDDLRHARVERVTTRQRYRRKSGAYLWVEVSFNLIRDPGSGLASGWVATVRDVSDRKAAEDAVRISEERLTLALESGSDGFWDCDLTTGSIDFSGRWPSLLGYRDGEIGSTVDAWRASLHPEDREHALALFIAHLKGQSPAFECEYRVRSKGGSYVWVYGRGKVVSTDEQGRATRVVGTHYDITKRKEAESVIAHMAMHDALTGLPNRVLFRTRLQQAMNAAERGGRPFAVLACDLDRFKAVNDSFGHSAGDSLLQTLAERLKAMAQGNVTVARLGGDEFAVVLGDLARKEDALVFAERLIAIVEQPALIEGRPVSIGVSVGIVVGPNDGRDVEQLFRKADIALYHAKATGRNSACFFERGMDTAVAERNGLEHDLREAVRHGGFTLNYQPVVDLASGSVSGFEALLRWHHPERGAIPPATFIPVAEETGLIVPLGEWVLREACRQAAAWSSRVSVNVSAVQFQKPDLLRRSVMLALATSGLPARCLELEVTERVFLQDAEAAIACLHRLRDTGIGIALDDFGAGHSSLSCLRRFVFTNVKIDRSLVRAIDDPDAATIVQAVVGLARRVGASITAEGVETRDQLGRLRELGCTDVQGFLMSKPLSGAHASELVRVARLARAA